MPHPLNVPSNHTKLCMPSCFCSLLFIQPLDFSLVFQIIFPVSLRSWLDPDLSGVFGFCCCLCVITGVTAQLEHGCISSPHLSPLGHLLCLVKDNLLWVITGDWTALPSSNESFGFVCFSPIAGSRSSSPGKLLGQSGYGRIPRATASVSSTPADKRSRIPRSQGCSRETSPSRMGLGKTRTLEPRAQNSLLV